MLHKTYLCHHEQYKSGYIVFSAYLFEKKTVNKHSVVINKLFGGKPVKKAIKHHQVNIEKQVNYF